MTLSSPKIGTKFLLTSYYNNLLGAGHYLSSGEREKRRGGQGYFTLAGGGGGLNFFIKMFSGVSNLNARYISKGVHWPRWVKHLNSRVQIIYVKQ